MTTNNNSSKDNIKNAVEQILGNKQPPAVVFTLDGFIDVYHGIAKITNSSPRVHIILLGKSAIVQFPLISNYSIAVHHKTRLLPADFSRIVSDIDFWGDKYAFSHWGQIKEERRNFLILFLVFVCVGLSVFAIGAPHSFQYESYLADPLQFPVIQNAIDALKTILEIVVTSTALFLSLFLVFTVAQNIEMIKDQFLFSEGLAYKYYRDDILISNAGLMCLLLGILGVILLVLPHPLHLATLNIFGLLIRLDKLTLLLPIISALSATGLAFCFVSIRYYFDRAVMNAGVSMAEVVLDQKRKLLLEKLKNKKDNS